MSPSDSTFCRACGTQLSQLGDHGTARTEPAAERGTDHDPWATGPGYYRPVDPDTICPRCKSHRQPQETACVNCGLPFSPTSNYNGVPAAVAVHGDPAGFWIRFLAVIIDSLLVFAIGAIIWPILFGDTFWVTQTEIIDGQTFSYTTTQSWHSLMTLAWDIVFVALYGATPGKAMLGIRIFDAKGNRRIGFVRATIRTFAEFLSAITLLIGYLMAAFRKDKRALHDLIAGTYPTKVN